MKKKTLRTQWANEINKNYFNVINIPVKERCNTLKINKLNLVGFIDYVHNPEIIGHDIGQF